MPRLDIWKHASGASVQNLVASACAGLVLAGTDPRPAYFSSPWMTDFPLLPNHFGQFAHLIADEADSDSIPFTKYLAHLSQLRPVRIITVRTDSSIAFAACPAIRNTPRIAVRFAPESYHEKGILAPDFYLEGSMNLTFSGIFIRDEKIIFHAGPESDELEVMHRAYLEFDRRWLQLAEVSS
jgi:hypothetical protein